MASEFRYRDPVLDRETLVVAVTQSGETADTLEAVRHARRQRARVLAVCNTNGSQIPRESDAVLYTHAGPEVGVAATKTFLAQVTANYLVGLALAQARGTKYRDEIAREFELLSEMPDAVARDADPDGPGPQARAGHRAARRRCCSSAGTSATRWRSRVRSSSRNSRTCTPRASPPVSSSTARSR